MKRNIVLYISQLADGGAERVMTLLANELTVKNYRVILVTTYHRENEYPVEKDVERIVLESVDSVQNGFRKNIGYILKLREICRNNQADVVISFLREPNVRALLATIGTGTKNIISVRSNPLKEYGGITERIIRRFLFPLADGCVFQTEDAKKAFPERLNKKSRVILNPVGKEFLLCKRVEHPHNVVSVGRLEREKNHSLLIRAFARVAGKYPEENLLIYGQGGCKSELEGLIDRLQLGQRIRLMGITRNIPDVLSNAKIFVLSSDSEGLPNALMEALAVGVPSVATDCPCGGPRILIEDGINGRLVPVGDEVKLAETLDILLGDLEYAEKLGNAAAIRAGEQFRPNIVFEQWREMIENVD